MKKFRAPFKSILLFFLMAIMVFPIFKSIGKSPVRKVQQQVQAVDFSEKELEKFVDVAVNVNEIQKKHYQEIVNAIQKEKLTVERFSELLETQPAPTKANASAKELKAFKKVYDTMVRIQDQAQSEATALIEKEIGMDKYQQIVLAYKQNEKVQAKIESLFEKKDSN